MGEGRKSPTKERGKYEDKNNEGEKKQQKEKLVTKIQNVFRSTGASNFFGWQKLMKETQLYPIADVL